MREGSGRRIANVRGRDVDAESEGLEAALRGRSRAAGADPAMRAVVDWLSRPLDGAAAAAEPSDAATRTAAALQDLGGMIIERS